MSNDPGNLGRFMPAPLEALQTGAPVSEALAMALAQNTSWLYEAIAGRSADPARPRRAENPHNHDGKNSEFLHQVQCLFRGYVRGIENAPATAGPFNCPQGAREAVPFILPIHVSGDPTTQADGISPQSLAYNWLPHYALRLPLGPYLRYVRLRLAAGNKTGAGDCRLWLACRQSAQELNVHRTGEAGIGGFGRWRDLAQSRPVTAGPGNYSIVEFALDLRPEPSTPASEALVFDPAAPAYVSLWCDCAPGASFSAGDDFGGPATGPCLVLTTR